FFFHSIQTSEFYTLSLHDALPISLFATLLFLVGAVFAVKNTSFNEDITRIIPKNETTNTAAEIVGEMNFSDKISVIFKKKKNARSEEHTSELQSRENLVCRLLLEK